LTALHLPHHDGSEVYVPEQPGELGGETTVLLRVPRGKRVDDVAVRYVRDGEPRVAVAEIDRETASDAWWRASFPVCNPVTPYRWLLSGGDFRYAWLNGAGVQPFDVPDADDFLATPGPGGPDWHLESVVYEVFPDRFARGGAEADPPDWALRREWSTRPMGRGPDTPFEWFGGDLSGIEGHLAHIDDVGATVLYLTPVFPAGSTHRYDATTFEQVDPLLGGDEALASLVRAAHDRGIRVLGDLTTNHVGAGHEWFAAARRDAAAPEREFFFFDDGADPGYECWLGVPSLPKLDYRSAELRRRMFAGETSVVEHWLRPPFALDGWRIDVANMTGRRREIDVATEVSRGVRSAAAAVRSDALVVAEHAHDARRDLRPDGWHGTMNYPGFTRPVWTWLRGDRLPAAPGDGFIGLPVGVPRLPGQSVLETMRRFRAGVPWESVLHSWVLLDSHDTARFRTIAGSRARHLVGVGLQMTTPGVPMVFAGDEIGLEGEWGEDARRTMPWDDRESWDTELLDAYRRLVSLRRGSIALSRGGIRYAHVSADAIAYLREAPGEVVLCLAARSGHDTVRLPLSSLGGSSLETLFGAEAPIERDEAVLPADGPAFHAWRVVTNEGKRNG
jgi:alpha-glucosidase